MLEYAGKAAFAWFLGFFPFFEIYVAVPAAVAMGLGPLSAIAWPVFGNFVPVLLIEFAWEHMLRFAWFRRWFAGRRSERMERMVSRHGAWVVLVLTPWIGVWLVAATAKTLGMKKVPLVAFSFVSILVYAVVIVLLIEAGIALAT